MSDNSVTLVGNLTRDLELRFTGSGTAAASAGIAVNSRRKGPDGEYEDEAHFFDLQLYGSLAENAAETLTRGTRVVATGRLNFRQWETDGGDRRSKVEVLVDSIGPDLRWATAQVAKNERGQ